jgi:hypothetical protein
MIIQKRIKLCINFLGGGTALPPGGTAVPPGKWYGIKIPLFFAKLLQNYCKIILFHQLFISIFA